MRPIQKLLAYTKAFSLAMDIWETSKNFPKAETYSLTDQIRRSSRSVCANLGEAWRRKKYPSHFVSKVTDSDAENEETFVWIEFSKNCGYIDNVKFEDWSNRNEEIGRLIGDILSHPEKYFKY